MTGPARVVLAHEEDEAAAATLADSMAQGLSERIAVVIVASGGRRSRGETDQGVAVWRVPVHSSESGAPADPGPASRRRRAARERARGRREPRGRVLDQVRRELARRSRGRSELLIEPLLVLRDAGRTGRVGAAWDLELSVGPVIDAEAANSVVVLSEDLLPLARAAARRAAGDGRQVAVTLGREPGRRTAVSRVRTLSPVPSPPIVLGIGPTNTAGQGTAWAAALRRAHASARTEVIGIEGGRYSYSCDAPVARSDFDHDAGWGLAMREHALRTWTHALIESGRPPFGLATGAGTLETVELLRAAGVAPALVFHGSDIRDPVEHARMHADSPFCGMDRRYVAALQETVGRNRRLVAQAGVPMFVSTPDQLEYVPQATWLPVVIDLDDWPVRPEVEGAESRPLVVHAPTNPLLKGTAWVEAAVAPLVAAGRIRYQAVTGVPPERAAAIVGQADVVIDQLTLGLYGVLACEALASGAVVIGQVGDRLRSAVPAPVPILEATPASLRSVLEEALAELATHRAQAPQRRAFVEHFHSGWYSAQRLLQGLSPGSGLRPGRDGGDPDTDSTTIKEGLS